jgi:hypothetical protein
MLMGGRFLSTKSHFGNSAFQQMRKMSSEDQNNFSEI